jgi:hypothetical protein
MVRLLTLAALALMIGGLVAPTPTAAQSPPYCVLQPPVPLYASPYGPVVGSAPTPYAGARYSFYEPSSISTSYFQPPYVGASFYSPRYYNPGPYYYTPAYDFTPGYYSYYYTPGYFRY